RPARRARRLAEAGVLDGARAVGWLLAVSYCPWNWLRASGVIRLCKFAVASFATRLRTVNESEYAGDEDQGCDGGAEQAADDGASERGVLLTAVAGSECHGDHADDHSERGHDDGTETGGTGFDCGLDGVAVLFETGLGEGDDEDAVGGGDAHAHDSSHEGGNAEPGSGEEEEDDDAGERGG